MQSAAVCIIFMSASVSVYFLQMNQNCTFSALTSNPKHQIFLLQRQISAHRTDSTAQRLRHCGIWAGRKFGLEIERSSPSSQHPHCTLFVTSPQHPVQNIPTAPCSKHPHFTLLRQSSLRPVHNVPTSPSSLRHHFILFTTSPLNPVHNVDTAPC